MSKIVALLICSTFICSAIAQTPVQLRIDPSGARGATASQVFDDVAYIPLETTKQSLFGEINQLVVTEKHFIIFDRNTNAILLFTKTGKFHVKIPGGSLQIQSFTYDREKLQIVVNFFDVNSFTANPGDMRSVGKYNFNKYVSGSSKYLRLRSYDVNGKFLADVKTAARLSVFGDVAIPFGNNYAVLYSKLANKNFPDSTLYQLSVFSKAGIYRQYLPYNIQKDIATCGQLQGRSGRGGLFETESDTTFLFTRPFDYTIYRLTPGNLSPLFSIMFPLINTVPAAYFSDSVASEEAKVELLRNYPESVTAIPAVRVIDRLLFLELHYPFAVSPHLIYSLGSGLLLDYSRITPDSSNYFLPVSNQYRVGIYKAFENAYLYTSISSLEMFQANAANQDKHPVYPPVLKTYFNKETRKSNPVIIRLKSKETL